MSLTKVKTYFEKAGLGEKILELSQSSATGIASVFVVYTLIWFAVGGR